MRKFLTVSFVSLALVTSVFSFAHVQHVNAQVAENPTGYAENLNKNIDSGYNIVMQKIMTLFAWLVGVSAITLDNAAYYTVVAMGKYIKDLSAIGTTWRIMRDVGNIVLIFGFLIAGIATIINFDLYGWKSKMIPKLLICAVLLNFSLFISEAVIDTGNLFATQFYTQINGGTPAGAKNWDIKSIANDGIAGKIMGQLKLQRIYGDALSSKTSVFSASAPWFIGFMGILLFLITAFVMFTLAFILIIRFVVLIFLIMLSPIGFAGLSVPKLSSLASQWWSELFKQTVTAPILFLLLYIALRVITDTNFLTGFGADKNMSQSWTGFTADNLTGFGGMILSFLVAIGLLLAVVISSKRLGAAGASWASKTAGKITFGATAFGLRTTVGATAFGLRTTVGSGSQASSRWLRTTRFGATKTGRLVVGGLDRGAKGSFDVRGTKTFGKIPFGGVDAGKAQEGGYRARQEKAIKKHDEYVKSIGKAIDERGATKEEEAKITAAATSRESAKIELSEAERENKTIEEQVKPQKAEIERLEKIVNDNRSKGTFDPAAIKALDEARKAPGMGKLTIANTRLANAKKRLEDAEKEEKDANKAPGDRISGEKRKAQLAYAGNIRGVGAVPSWAMFGPGGSIAARKIIKDAKKNPDKEFRDKLRKAMEAEEKESTGETKPKENESGKEKSNETGK